MADDPNEQLKFSTSPSVRAYIDALAAKGWHGVSRSAVIDHIIRNAINAMRQSPNPPVSDEELARLVPGKPRTKH